VVVTLVIGIDLLQRSTQLHHDAFIDLQFFSLQA
jgi:hypothetical protein